MVVLFVVGLQDQLRVVPQEKLEAQDEVPGLHVLELDVARVLVEDVERHLLKECPESPGD